MVYFQFWLITIFLKGFQKNSHKFCQKLKRRQSSTIFLNISLYDILINLRDVGWKEEKAASWVARRGLKSVRIGSLNPHLLYYWKGDKGIWLQNIFEDYHNYNSIHYLYDAFHILKIITPGVKLRKFWGTVGYLGKDLRGTFPLKTIWFEFCWNRFFKLDSVLFHAVW